MFETGWIRTETSLANVEVHDELASTNDHALDLVRRQATNTPALIIAQRQTAGRGRRENKWWSGTGSLTFSLIVSPSTTARLSLLPFATALAIADSIESVTSLRNIEIKWPNDLLASAKKLAGILIESVPTQPYPTYVIGMGINVNNSRIADVDLQNSIGDRGLSPTSIFLETAEDIPLQPLLIAVVKQLAHEIESLNDGAEPDEMETLIERVNKRLAYIGKSITIVSAQGKVTSGTCRGITADGGLRVERSAGIVDVFEGSICETG